MRIFIPGFLIFCIYALFTRWYFICEVRALCDGEVEVVEPDRLQTLALREGDTIILEGFDQFLFKEDSIKATLNENNENFLDSVAYYLATNPSKYLTITGKYLKLEEDAKASFFDNIGIARAAQIELLLEDMGVDEQRISIDHATVDADTLFEPLEFEVYIPNSTGYQRLQYNFLDNTYSDANFAYNSDIFEPGPGFLAYSDSLKIFLDEQPEYTLLITGHTDSIASEGYNSGLGLRRAASAREWLKTNEIGRNIEVASMGEKEPIAPNSKADGSDNPEGRQKNRRVNFKLLAPEDEG